MICEFVVTTVSAGGDVHIAPIGLIADGADWIIAPFHPSGTLDNLRAIPEAVANHVSDVRIFAGCLTGRREWPCVASSFVRPPRLEAALTHEELQVFDVIDHPQRPRFRCRVVHQEMHAPFLGFNRAQAAVIEAAILVSRLVMLPREKVESEIAYLQIAVEKAAGPHEREAWDWLMECVSKHYSA